MGSNGLRPPRSKACCYRRQDPSTCLPPPLRRDHWRVGGHEVGAWSGCSGGLLEIRSGAQQQVFISMEAVVYKAVGAAPNLGPTAPRGGERRAVRRGTASGVLVAGLLFQLGAEPGHPRSCCVSIPASRADSGDAGEVGEVEQPLTWRRHLLPSTTLLPVSQK